MTTNDGANVIGKSFYGQKQINVTLRKVDNVSKIELLLSKIEGVDIFTFNYVDIPGFNRKYFIDSISIVANNLYRIQLSVDVLETYKADILTSQSKFNRKIKSGDYMDIKINHCVNAESTIWTSNKGFSGEPSIIISTIGVGQ